MYTTKASLAALRQKQFDAYHNSEPGSWYDSFSDMLHQQEDNVPVLTLRFGNLDSRYYDADGVLIATRKDDDSDVEALDGKVAPVMKLGKRQPRGWMPDVMQALRASEWFVNGSNPAVTDFNGSRYAAGLTVVTGQGNVGKTPLLHALASELHRENEGYQVVRFGEPLAGYSTDITEFLDELALALVNNKIIVLDSLKDIINSSSGNASVGGLSRDAFSFLSDIGSIAASRGSLVLAAVNPSSKSERVLDETTEAIISNATSVIVPSSSTGGLNEVFVWDVVSRTGEGQRRLTWDLSMRYGDYSVVEIITKDRNKRTGTKPAAAETPDSDKGSDFADPELNAIIKRMYSR